MKHNLMDNNITHDDNTKVINFLKNPRLTNGRQESFLKNGLNG